MPDNASMKAAIAAASKVFTAGGTWRSAVRAAVNAALAATCRVCGCTDDDCSGCVQRTGSPCRWAAPGLCTACAPEVADGTITRAQMRASLGAGDRWRLLCQDGADPIVGMIDPIAPPLQPPAGDTPDD